jgi:hypothetical protein
LKKSPLKDLCRVFEHPETISKRLLEQGIARRASKFSICRRKEEGFISLRFEEQESSEGVAPLCVRRLCRSAEVRILQGFGTKAQEE